MLVGFVLLVAGGVSAYPSLRGALELDSGEQGFGDQSAPRISIVDASESLPQPSISHDVVTASEIGVNEVLLLPETPLLSDASDISAPESLELIEEDLKPLDEVLDASVFDVQNDAFPSREGVFVPSAPGRLIIPAIGLEVPVETVGWSVVVQNGQQVSMWDVPNSRAAGWLETSAQIGQPGNTVLDGHHNVFGEVFRDLVNLKEGDSIQIQTANGIRNYIVSIMTILPERDQPLDVRIENAKWIQPTDDERLTLVTCWPYTDNSHRLIVVATPRDEVSRGDILNEGAE